MPERPRDARRRGRAAVARPLGAAAAHRAVVVGYGPTGRTLTRLLRDNGIEPTVIELNMDTVRQLREEGVRAVYGDASHRDTLEAAGIAGRGSLILTRRCRQQPRGDPPGARAEPEASACWRADQYLRDVAALSAAGADERVLRRGRSGAGDDRGDAPAAGRDARTDRSRTRPRPRRAVWHLVVWRDPRLAYHARYLDAGRLSTPVRCAPSCAPERPRLSGDRPSRLQGRSRPDHRRRPQADRSHGARDAAGPVGLAPVRAGSHRPTRQRADRSPARAGVSRRCQPRRD